jgi:hypothetical protein
LTQKLIQHVQVGKENFLAVLGVSGSGKSSLLRAGLIYQLQQQRRLPETEEWKIRIFSPGERPLVSLATAFLDELATDMQRAEQLKVADEAIAQGATGLARLIRASRSPRTLLIVDQFEEIFTVCQSHSDRQQFISSLLGALKQTGDKLCIIFAMRDDFLGKCAAYHELADLIQTNLVMVTPMSLEELQQAIREPAAKLGRKVEENLINAILKDLGVEVGQPTQEPEPGMLPLLSYTLEQLWQRQKLNWLKLDSYHQLGGVRKTLENLAEKTYKELSAEEQRVTDLIFINLTQLGEGTPDTRKQVPQRDLVSLGKSAQLVEQVIQKLALAKLIVTSEQRRGEENVAVVDVAHEALIRHWSRLRELLDNNREAIRTERRIQEAAEEWEDKGKSVDYLLTGLRLAEAEKFLQEQVDIVPLSGLSCELIEASQKERDKQGARNIREKKRILMGLLFALFMTTGFSIMVSLQLWQIQARSKAKNDLEILEEKIAQSSPIRGTEEFAIEKIITTNKMLWMAVYDENKRNLKERIIKKHGLGLWQYNLQAQSLTKHLQNRKVSSIWAEGEDIWVGVKELGVLNGRLSNGKMVFQTIKRIADIDTEILSLVKDKQGNLWLGTNKGLYQQTSEKWKYIDDIHKLCKSIPSSSLRIDKIVIDINSDFLWMTAPEGLIRLGIGNDKSITCYFQKKQDDFQLEFDGLTTLNFNSEQRTLAIGNYAGNVSIITNVSNSSSLRDSTPITYLSLGDSILDLAILPNKSLLALTNNYVSLHNDIDKVWIRIYIKRLPIKNLYNMILGNDKYLWIGTNQGVYRSNKPILE